MPNILISNKVRDLYTSGMSLNDAIATELGEQIQEIKDKNSVIKDLTPIQVLMFSADVKKDDPVEKFLNAYTSGGMEANEWLFPAWMEATVKEAQYAQDILPYITDTTINIEGNIVRSAYLDLMDDKNKKAIKRSRIAEGADIPIGKITVGEKAITLWKHGRGIELTYEAMRRMKIKLFVKHMEAISRDLAQQNLEFASDVLLNGDGNNNSATELGATSGSNVITGTELADFMIDYYFDTHVTADTLIANRDMAKQISHMMFDTGLAFGANARIQFEMPQFKFNNIKVLAADVPDNKILVSSRENTLVRYEENGSNIQENQRYIRNQTELMTFTENSGYAINVAGTNRYITIKS